MGLTKINQILKKYKQLHKQHIDSWVDAQKRIRIDDSVYATESYNYMCKGYKLFDEMIKELDGHEIFPKKLKNKP